MERTIVRRDRVAQLRSTTRSDFRDRGEIGAQTDYAIASISANRARSRARARMIRVPTVPVATPWARAIAA